MLFFLIGALVSIASLLLAVFCFSQAVKTQQEEITWYHNQYQTESGYNQELGNYLFLTIDGCETWLRIGKDEAGKKTAVQVPKEVVEAIRTHWAAIHRLAEHPPDLTNPTENDLKNLREAGIGVERRGEA